MTGFEPVSLLRMTVMLSVQTWW